MKSGFYSSGLHQSSSIWLFHFSRDNSDRNIICSKDSLLAVGLGGWFSVWPSSVRLGELPCLDLFAGQSQLRLIACRDVPLTGSP